jgi:hypothetical protein
MRPLHLAAIFAAVLVAWTGVNSVLRPPPPPDRPQPKTKPTRTSEARCTIKRAVFGGTQAAVLKAYRGRIVHYVVLDLPTDNPRMPEIQSAWIAANYGGVEPFIVGIFPTVEAAVGKAADLCKTN